MVTRAWFVYLIECQGGSLYTGISTNVEARYSAHLAGKGARYTRMHPPEKLLAAIEFPDRSSALKAEYQIKQMSANEKRALAEKSPIFSRTAPAEAVPDSHI